MKALSITKGVYLAATNHFNSPSMPYAGPFVFCRSSYVVAVAAKRLRVIYIYLGTIHHTATENQRHFFGARFVTEL